MFSLPFNQWFSFPFLDVDGVLLLSENERQVRCLLFVLLGTRGIVDFGVFQIWGHVHRFQDDSL